MRSQKKIALAVASSGIAALLLPGGRTAHSRFKIPFKLTSTSVCNLNLNSEEAKLIKQTQLIIWDECPMLNRFGFEALDRSMRDIMGQVDPKYANIPFGNKIIVFGGDFRQILPVIKKGTRSDIVKAAFNRSYLWDNVKIFKLKINMRINKVKGSDKKEAKEFSDYLLEIGEGRVKTKTDTELSYIDYIDIPKKLIQNMNMIDLIKKTYPDIEKVNENKNQFTGRAIVTPKMVDVDQINQIATNLMPGEIKEYFSCDSMLKESNQNIYPIEFLNMINVSGLPSHKLSLKKGTPIMLLRNINPNEGLYNGTRLIVKNFYSKIIEAEIIMGHLAGKTVFIPRMPLIPSDTNLPFDLLRIQFPIKVLFYSELIKNLLFYFKNLYLRYHFV